MSSDDERDSAEEKYNQQLLRDPDPAPQCYCENSYCETCKGEGCENSASDRVQADYIVNICDRCAESMPAEYLHAIEQEGDR